MKWYKLKCLILNGFLLCILVVCAGCERKTKITSGEFEGLIIGMTKEAVVPVLLKQNVETIAPAEDEQLILKNPSKDDLAKLDPSLGICVYGESGFTLQINFNEAGQSVVVYHSTYVKPEEFGIDTPQTRGEIIDKISKMVEQKGSIKVSHCILDVKYINVKEPSSLDLENMQRFNTWIYNFPSSFSTITLHFSDGKLAEIFYVDRPS